MNRWFFLLAFLPCAWVFGQNESTQQTVQVIAFDYPPYLQAAADDGGLSFQALRAALLGSDWLVEPLFLPSARASHLLANDEHWLASFMPPPAGSGDVDRVPLNNTRVKSGLFRIPGPGAFIWSELSELSGHSVMITRTATMGGLADQLKDAGLLVIPINGIDQGLSMLLSGRSDYLLSLEQTGYYFADQQGIAREKLQFRRPC
ncbi:hypothetical protein ACQUQU_01255 [Thalassolituus sp. LLYu03]|uniref:hypothetical protein n=1 Tax=Thalassolituus sp. LLYu03 TaxID=3421656 RepID=UPI003D270849